MQYLIVAGIGQDGVSDHGHARIQQLSALTELDGANADALLWAAKGPVTQSAETSIQANAWGTLTWSFLSLSVLKKYTATYSLEKLKSVATVATAHASAALRHPMW